MYWDFADEDAEPHILYVSFPSCKDPYHNQGPELRQTGEVVTFIRWEEWTKWSDSKWQRRPEDYNKLKESICNRILDQLKKHLPDVMNYLDYYEISTPLTTGHFMNNDEGAIYGLESTIDRYNTNELSCQTPIGNFYMTGVDIGIPGISGGMISGIMTASAIEPKVWGIMDKGGRTNLPGWTEKMNPDPQPMPT